MGMRWRKDTVEKSSVRSLHRGQRSEDVRGDLILRSGGINGMKDTLAAEMFDGRAGQRRELSVAVAEVLLIIIRARPCGRTAFRAEITGCQLRFLA
jgi:hypothetical protein